MKKIFITVCLLLTVLTGCNTTPLTNPNTNLEFWIAENVDDVDFSKHQEKYGIMGGYEYYGLGYIPTIDEYGHCVVYTITSYPDYSSKAQHITAISITDPNIHVYGLTVNSEKQEIKTVMENEGFTVEEIGYSIIARKNDYTFSFEENQIYIMVKVTNKLGIIF